jgi:DNA mismatch endonuclease (patch repair protein)
MSLGIRNQSGYSFEMDKVSPEKRSWTMAQVKGRDTDPEKIMRSLLHHMGYRFRLQRADLPGKPDIVLPKFKTALFVHGCFWHRHPGCKRATTPTTNTDYWDNKFARTVARDAKNQRELAALDWHVLIVWECELKDLTTLQARLFDSFNTLSCDGA